MNDPNESITRALRELTDALPVGEAPELGVLRADANDPDPPRRWAVWTVAAALVAASVGAMVLISRSDDPGAVASATDPVNAGTGLANTVSTSARSSVDIVVPASPCTPTEAELRDDIAVAKQGGFAFAGTVKSVELRVNPHDVDEELTTVPAAGAEPMPWVTFDVDRWYTNDWGATFSVFMPGLDVRVGQTWRLGGNAFVVYMDGFDGQSGEVDPCFAGPDDEAGRQVWDDAFGGSVEAGAGTPESDPDAEVVAALRAAQQKWRDTKPDSYSVLLSVSSTSEPTDGQSEPCSPGSGGTFRIVVDDGVPIEAVDVFNLCSADATTLPTVDGLFDEAVRVAGAKQFDYTVDFAGDAPLEFYASDRSIEFGGRAFGVSTNNSPAIVGWDVVRPATADARQAWEAGGPRSYRLTIETGGGERSQYGVVARIIDGRPETLRVNGRVVDESTLELPWQPYTVEHLFDLIDEQADDGNVIAVFDETGSYPTDLWFDPMLDADDDESEFHVTVEQI